MRRLRQATVMATAAVMLACGVPMDDAPRRIAPEDVPFPREGTASPDSAGAATVTIFLAQASHLAPVKRQAPTTSVGDRLDALVEGPTESELPLGLRTAIGPETRVTHTGTTDSVASVDLSKAFVDVVGEEQILAVAQIVFTVTEATGVSSVQFSLDGRVVAVPTEDGTLSDAPIDREAFRGLVAP